VVAIAAIAIVDVKCDSKSEAHRFERYHLVSSTNSISRF